MYCMKVQKDTYRSMNKGYNAIFDGWQEIEDRDPDVDAAMNAALVLLDKALDVIKQSVTEDTAQQAPSAAGFRVYGGKD